jgi:hypothetical protein
MRALLQRQIRHCTHLGYFGWLIAFNLLPHCNLPLPGVANQSHHHFHGKYHLIG